MNFTVRECERQKQLISNPKMRVSNKILGCKEPAAPKVSLQENRTHFIYSGKTHTRHYVLPDHSLDQLRGLLFLEVLQLL